MATLLATLPNFNGLIDAARYHEWQAPVEIWKGNKTQLEAVKTGGETFQKE